MRVLLAIAVCCFAFMVVGSTAAGTGKGRGFGDDYDWYTLEDGLSQAKTLGKPGMIVMHKSWCGACKALGRKFSKSTDVLEAAQDFVMINVQDDDEPQEEEYAPDGQYIPRILFHWNGAVQTHIKNPARIGQQYQFFYQTPEQVLEGMKVAKAEFMKPIKDEL